MLAAYTFNGLTNILERFFKGARLEEAQQMLGTVFSSRFFLKKVIEAMDAAIQKNN